MFRSSVHQLCCSTTSLWVELIYWILALYRILVRSKKWYHHLLWHFLDMSLPITEVCTDSLGHYPKYSEKAGASCLFVKVFQKLNVRNARCLFALLQLPTVSDNFTCYAEQCQC